MLISLIVVIVVVCLFAWLIQSAPLPAPFGPVAKWVLMAILVIVACYFLLRLAGIHLP